MGTSGSRRFTRTDLLVGIGLAGLVSLLALPALRASRDSSRRARCADNLRQIGVALQSYLGAHQSLPYAARWTSEGLNAEKMDAEPWAGHATHENWALVLLPYLNQGALADSFDRAAPVTDPRNAKARTTELTVMRCPADSFNRPDNHYAYKDPQVIAAGFARGDYAINGGSQVVGRYPGYSSAPAADGPRYEFDPATKSFRWWGNGVAGVNKSFGLADFKNGLSTLVAVDEVRAGVHTTDPRGVWAFGQVGGSITFAHGVTGDDCGPNNPGERADDILNCIKLHAAPGTEVLAREGMPCCWYIQLNGQATSRSLHPGGVHSLMMDGAVRFVLDAVDPSLWHVMHSRETPAGLIDKSLIETPHREPAPPDRPAGAGGAGAAGEHLPANAVNSAGMELVLIPPGEFIMGVPDVGSEHEVPPETPPHRVRITRPFYLGACEVTQEQYQRVMGTNPSWHTTSAGLKGQSKQDTGRLPVEQVSWDDAAEFCRRLSERPAEKAAGLAYRLPTEAEWEYGCRAGKSEPYAWSRTADPLTGENAGEQRWGALDVVAVGSYPPNRLGLHDMRGNVYEWCADWFARDYYRRSPADDPPGPASGYLRVVRGGDWLFVGEGCMINRRVTLPWQSSRYLGFRVAATATGGAARPRPAPVPDRLLPPLAVYTYHRNPRWMELTKFDPVRRSARLLKSGWSVSPAWSPDGRRIAFAEAKADIWVMDPEGAGLRNLTQGAFKSTQTPAWSPDGTRVVFSASRDGAAWSLAVVNTEDDGLRPLGSVAGDQTSPAWSPDGRQILFVLGRAHPKRSFDLVVTDTAGAGLRTVRAGVPSVASPSWSPGGDRFAFTDWGETKEQLRVRVANLNGEVVAEVTGGGAADVYPAWSPDGRSIAYVHFDDRKDDRGDLMVYDVATGTRSVLSEGTLIFGEDCRPTWGPQPGR